MKRKINLGETIKGNLALSKQLSDSKFDDSVKLELSFLAIQHSEDVLIDACDLLYDFIEYPVYSSLKNEIR